LFLVGFWEISLKMVYSTYKNVFKCREMYGIVWKWLKKVEIDVARIRNHVASREAAE